MTEIKAEYVTETVTNADNHKTTARDVIHTCGYLIGKNIGGVLIRNHEPIFGITMPCPKCGDVINWRADKLYNLIRHWDRVWSGIIEDLEAPLVILEARNDTETVSEI